MQNTIIAVVVVVLLLAGGYFFFVGESVAPATEEEAGTEVTSGGNAMPVPEPGNEGVIEKEVMDAPAGSGASAAGTAAGSGTAGKATSSVKSFTVSGASNFTFTPNTMTVKKGDTVRITFKNVSGFHDFVLEQFDVRTKQIAAGKEETIEFVADKTGKFEYYCSVDSHRANGMKGTLTVTE